MPGGNYRIDMQLLTVPGPDNAALFNGQIEADDGTTTPISVWMTEADHVALGSPSEVVLRIRPQ